MISLSLCLCKNPISNFNNYKTTTRKHIDTPILFYRIIQNIDLSLKAQKRLYKERLTAYFREVGKGMTKNLKIIV